MVTVNSPSVRSAACSKYRNSGLARDAADRPKKGGCRQGRRRQVVISRGEQFFEQVEELFIAHSQPAEGPGGGRAERFPPRPHPSPEFRANLLAYKPALRQRAGRRRGDIDVAITERFDDGI